MAVPPRLGPAPDQHAELLAPAPTTPVVLQAAHAAAPSLPEYDLGNVAETQRAASPAERAASSSTQPAVAQPATVPTHSDKIYFGHFGGEFSTQEELGEFDYKYDNHAMTATRKQLNRPRTFPEYADKLGELASAQAYIYIHIWNMYIYTYIYISDTILFERF